MNKSQLVRDLLKSNPKMKPKEVVEALAKDGHKITANLVYFIKGKAAGKKAKKKRVAKAAKTALGGGTIIDNGFVAGDPLSLINDVKALATRTGGYEKLKELVDALAN
ncbi:MAG TPA: hypothetical protein VFE62_20050 [Gemmataceae bacterium]|nr:hypothetical protein [Gemmataceae bacterium]